MITPRDIEVCSGACLKRGTCTEEQVRMYRAAFNCRIMRKRYGLGDWVAVILSCCFITPTRGCKSPQRKAWLNGFFLEPSLASLLRRRRHD